MEDEDLLVPLSALEHWSYCRRQCGLIHLENLWAESGRTAEGRQLHQKVDLPGLEQRPGMRIARALDLKSDTHRLAGRADVVVFYEDAAYPRTGRPFPVEYKRGVKNHFRHAEWQLCAQALCLEEMLNVAVPTGAVYHGASRRRREVCFTADLRKEVIQATRGILAMLQTQKTPPAEPGNQCHECSLRDLCLPEMPRLGKVHRYLEGLGE